MQQASSTYTAMRENVSAGLDMQRWLELLAVLVIALSVIGLVTARLGIFNAAPIWVSGLLLTYGYHRWTASAARAAQSPVPAWHVIAVVGIGLLFRLSPYAWILGGQDQGVYVNMAMELARTGALEPTDGILSRITDPALLELYRAGNYGSAYLSGVYSTPEGLVFQFYHLFPVWLALFGDGMGATAAVYGLTFFSLLSLLFFQRVAHLISGSAVAGLIAGLLLAVNPLHAFFSKFPVTEVPTLALSLMSFSLLIAFWRAPAGEGQRRLLVLSALAMGLLFMTRISGFMYMPFLYVFSLAVVLHVQERGRRNALLAWCIAVLGFYAFSIFYGLKWSAPYSNDIYRLSFQPLLGDRWGAALSGLVVVLCVGWVGVWLASRSSRPALLLRRLMAWGARLLPAVAFACLVIALYKAYRYGYTDAYASDPWYGQRWNLSHKGLRSVLSTSLIASVGYLSPFILVSFFASVLFGVRDTLMKMLLFFVICFLGYVSVLQWALPYQPYYARYLLSEFVPYIIMFVVCVWAMQPAGRPRRYIGIALVLGGAWTLLLTSMQLGKQEQGGVVESVDQMTREFDQGDVVLLERTLGGTLGTRLATTLNYVEGLSVIRIQNSAVENKEYLDFLSAAYDDVFLVTDKHGRGLSNYTKIDSIRFVQDQYAHGITPPVEIERIRDLKIDVYRYSRVAEIYSRESKGGVDFGDGWSGQEEWGVWTSGNAATLQLNLGVSGDPVKQGVLKISGRVYVSTKAPEQRIRILVNGEPVEDKLVRYPARHFEVGIQLGKLGGRSMQVEIQTPDAVSPASLGYSGDTRTLGFGLESIRVVEPTQAP